MAYSPNDGLIHAPFQNVNGVYDANTAHLYMSVFLKIIKNLNLISKLAWFSASYVSYDKYHG